MKNGLTPGKLAAVFAPLLLRRVKTKGKITNDASKTQLLIQIVETMIDHYDTLFETTNVQAFDTVLQQHDALRLAHEKYQSDIETLEAVCEQKETVVIRYDQGLHPPFFHAQLCSRLYVGLIEGMSSALVLGRNQKCLSKSFYALRWILAHQVSASIACVSRSNDFSHKTVCMR